MTRHRTNPIGFSARTGRSAYQVAVLLFALLLVATSANSVRGQRGGEAYCALRDPNRSIFELFPKATGFTSSVRNMIRSREMLNKKLPYKLHFNELGRHTLYIALEGSVPIGIVHVRPAAHEWGLVEVAWALDLDLNVLGFKIQRCRSRHRRQIESDAFRKQLLGCGKGDFESLLRDSGYGVNLERISVPKDATDLVAAVLRSGLSSLVITEAVWPKLLGERRLQHRAAIAFGKKARVTLLGMPYIPRVMKHLESLDPTRQKSGSIFQRHRALAARAVDPKAASKRLGYVLRTVCAIDKKNLELWWVVDAAGKIAAVDSDWQDARLRAGFQEVVGATRSELGECLTPAQIAAFEVLAVCEGLDLK